MAASLTKSPHRNPNSRSSEINNPMRRSFSGSPFSKPSVVTKPKGFSVTPANSPSDFPRRNSISRENIPYLPRNHGDKENGKEQELKPARVRSPSPFKGSKNFMSPTISAAAKVTASPKKKILAENNESVLRTSFSSSDGKASFNSVSLDHVSAAASPSEKKLAGFKAPWISNTSVVDHKVPSTPKNDSKLRPNSHALEENVQDLDLSFIGSIPHGSQATLAPLDADPLTRPYDAETNFTSPRPQFLCYRPNPRIRQGKVLEDSFVSDSPSGAELIQETETQSEISSEEMVHEKEVSDELVQEDEQEVLHVSEPNPLAHMSKGCKLQFFRRPKTVAFLLTILVACLSVTVTDSPVVGLVLKDPSHSSYFYVPSEFTAYAKAQWDSLAQNFGIWYAKSVAYLCELVFNLRAHKLGPLKYSNLTSLYDDQFLVDGYLGPDSVMGWEKVTDLLEEEVCGEIEEYGNDDSECEEQEHEKVEVHDNNEEVQEDCDSPTSELHLGLVDEHDGPESTVHDNIEVSEVVAEEPSEAEADLIQEDLKAPQVASSEIHASTEDSRTGDFNWLSDQVLNQNVLGICLLAILAAGTAFYICARKGNTFAVPTASVYDQPLFSAKKLDISPKSACASVDLSLHESWATEVDLVGESCPSEMSSFRTSSSCSKKAPKDCSEAQSEERKPRKKNYSRESLASSDYSVGSISTYGSFTTYEKISAKHANGEAITPVRRSNRIIRKQVTSP